MQYIVIYHIGFLLYDFTEHIAKQICNIELNGYCSPTKCNFQGAGWKCGILRSLVAAASCTPEQRLRRRRGPGEGWTTGKPHQTLHYTGHYRTSHLREHTHASLRAIWLVGTVFPHTVFSLNHGSWLTKTDDPTRCIKESCMLALFHYHSAVLSLLALVAAAVYYQVFRQGLETETMAAQVSRSVVRTVFAREQSEVSSTARAMRNGSDHRYRALAPESAVLLALLSYLTSPHS
jgi:hypothetical protein